MSTTWKSKRIKPLAIASIMVIEAVVLISLMLDREAKNEERYEAEARREALAARYVVEDCQYSIDAGGYWANTLEHHADCRNPIHWGHVINDTSWWGQVREAEQKMLEGAKGGKE